MVKMQNFLQIAAGIATLPLLLEIQRQSELWNENTLRTKHPGTAHSEVSDIWLWFNDVPKVVEVDTLFGRTIDKPELSKVVNDKEVIPYRGWNLLPSARNIIFPLMSQVQAIRLGRVMITKLPPGKTITPHVDGGAPATYFQRYQVALQCLPGNKFRIENEAVEFKTGDVWMIDNKKEHEVINNSETDRIVMIADMRSE